MGPQIWSPIDRIFCHIRPFFALTPITTQKQIFKKMKKMPGYVSCYTHVPKIMIQ